MKLSIIIPCYNEEAGIPNLAKELRPVLNEIRKQYTVELIFVDDGSKDNTAKLIQKHFGKEKGFVLCRHKANKNLGAALRTGFARATGDFIACLDSDCTYTPKLLITMLKCMDSGIDIVTASPYHPLGRVDNVPAYRLFLSKGVSLLYGLITGQRIHTFTAMVRLYRKKVIKSLPKISSGFLGVTEILVYSRLNGFKVREVPAALKSRKFGESKMKVAKTIQSHIGLLLKLVGMRLKVR